MKHLLLSAVAGLALMPTISTAATFEFNLTDWSDGGVFSGSFEAEDLDGDGQISEFSGEVTGFSATYQSGQFNGPISFDDNAFSGNALTGLVYNLDGLGTIGDSTFGDIEGLGVTSSDGNFYLAVGPGPVGPCDGQQDCGVLQDLNGLVFVDDDVIIDDNDGPFFGTILATNDQSIQVTSGPLGEFSGEFEENPLLPDDVQNGSFVFDIDGNIVGAEIFFIDPEIAVGYTYEVTGTTFTAVQAPSLTAVPDADGEYTLEFGTTSVVLGAGEIYNFDPADDITMFTITGIDTGLMLDPTDGTAFVTGIAVDPVSSIFSVSQTPITINTDVTAVPLPASAWLLFAGMAGLFGFRRRVTS